MGSILAAVMTLSIPVLIYYYMMQTRSRDERGWWYTVLLGVMGVLYVPVTIQLVLLFIPVPGGIGFRAGFLFIFSFFRMLFMLGFPQFLIACVFLLAPACTGALILSRVKRIRDRSFALHVLLLYLYVLLFWVVLLVLIYLFVLVYTILERAFGYFSSVYREVLYRIY